MLIATTDDRPPTRAVVGGRLSVVSCELERYHTFVMAERSNNHYTASDDPEIARLQHELSEAYQTIRALQRQLNKEQQRHNEVVRAHKKTVANLAEAGRERGELEHERDQWRTRAEFAPVPFKIGGLTLDLTTEEIDAIRKAITRLHHGDAERIRAWDSALDPLEPH